MRKWISETCKRCSLDCKNYLELEGDTLKVGKADHARAAMRLGDARHIKFRPGPCEVELHGDSGELKGWASLTPDAFFWLKAKHDAAKEKRS